MATHALSVHDGDDRVGTVSYDALADTFAFAYDAAWLGAARRYPLSPAIPFGAPAASATIRRFIENLLPEGHALDIASEYGQVARNNVYGLIRQLGGETAGALRFHAGAPPPPDAPRLREITSEELDQRIRAREQVPFSVWDGRVRLSIAGYQDKLAVYVEGGRLWLADGEGVASTHIVKPEAAQESAPCMVANEHFCMTLAARLGLPAAPVSILRIPSPVLLIERFDRVREGGAVRRLHIVDACQALDLPVSYKYERNFGAGSDIAAIRDGVGFERLFSLRGQTVDQAVAQRVMLQWATLQFLIGNSDAHGKNFSFFCTRAGLTPTPFYDLVSVVQYPRFQHDLAMAYGDAFELDKITPFAFADFLSRIGIRRPTGVRIMTALARAASSQAEAQAGDAAYVGAERDMVRAIAALVRRQAEALQAMAPAILAVDADLL
ncbi:HipA domain-containing protein [Cupriavidus sp. 30B13]|uniref:HipA domain-containing protein n=1 Tax=Cupriavidus sp. 30B13 TaxID=3384241 RepID=UPI003B90C4CD